MNKKRLLLLPLFFWVVSVQAADGVTNVPSQFSVEETANRMETILKQKGMTIFNRIRHSDGAKAVGIDLRDTQLLIFGNPKVGSLLMQCQQSVAIDLPLKALVWQDENSKVWISYNQPAYLQRKHQIKGCADTLTKMEKALAGITQAAANK
ncbi:DUF302 domain-containing protein [Thiomicrorhabdus sp. ZW0627]|uniref:DUF302 domain-containing protein n=1 Tax=Thiomicrorhabdus sp. ZW0627 TaxID=3039774 RepID=UPI0024365F9B|nr:DUF302 domain-containing protein [Thiomicrorhabdus sp. ZW0627]MDG6772753.1 DUF302 domain-containing protein [Thiomicrorhabdus sp. ZW0627]